MNIGKWLGTAAGAIVLSSVSTVAVAGTRANESKTVYAVAKPDTVKFVSVLGKSGQAGNGFSDTRGRDGKGRDKDKDKKGRGHYDHGNGNGHGHDHHGDNKSNGC